MTPNENETAVLYRTAAALLALLALTIGLSFVPLGPFNVAVALTIAAFKGLLVAFYFMELRRNSRLLWVLAAAGLLWLLFLLAGTLADLITRTK